MAPCRNAFHELLNICQSYSITVDVNFNDNDNDNEISFILTQVNTSLLATLLGLLCGIANTIT